MTRIHAKVTGATDPTSPPTYQCGALDQFDTPDDQCPEGWICSDDLLDDDTLWPLTAHVTLTEQRDANAHQTRKAFILQKDPDGCWQLDRWSENTAGAIRPDRGSKQTGDASPRQDCGISFIVEIK